MEFIPDQIMKKLSLLPVIVGLLLSGCGGGDSGDNSIAPATMTDSLPGVAQLGYLGGATVNIYSLDPDGEKTLIATETTSEGNTLADVGRFDVHKSALQANKFYIYEVSGGQDYDADDDGVKDATPTPNSGTLHSLVKGAWVSSEADSFRVTVLSEVIYQMVGTSMRYRQDQLEADITQSIRYVLDSTTGDLDRSGQVDALDMVRFNPVIDGLSIDDSLYSEADITTMSASIRQGERDFQNTIRERQTGTVFGGYIPASDFSLNDVVVSADGERAYLSLTKDTAHKIEVLDISDKQHPVLLNQLALPSVAYKLALSDDILYATKTDGFHRVSVADITTNTAPNITTGGLSSITGTVHDLVLGRGAIILLTINYDGNNDALVYYDTTSSSVQQVLPAGTNAFSLIIASNHNAAYVIDNQTLKSFSLNINAPHISAGNDLVLSPTLYPQSLSLSHDNNRIVASIFDGFVVADVSNPTMPLALYGNTANDSTFHTTEAIFNHDSTFIYSVDNSLITVFDHATGERVSLLAKRATGFGFMAFLITDDGENLIIFQSGGMKILNLAALHKSIELGLSALPHAISSLEVGTPFSNARLGVSENRDVAMVTRLADSTTSTVSGFIGVDISNPAAIALKPADDYSSIGGASVRDIEVVGDKILLATNAGAEILGFPGVGTAGRATGTVAYSNSASAIRLGANSNEAFMYSYSDINLIGGIGTGSPFLDQTIVPSGGSNAVTSNATGTFYVASGRALQYFTRPGSNYAVNNSAQIDFSASISDVVAGNGVLYAVNSDALYVVDGPAITEVPAEHSYYGNLYLTADQNRLYITDEAKGLMAFDATIPNAPIFIGAIGLGGGSVSDVKISTDGKLAYVITSGNSEQQMHVIDLETLAP